MAVAPVSHLARVRVNCVNCVNCAPWGHVQNRQYIQPSPHRQSATKASEYHSKPDCFCRVEKTKTPLQISTEPITRDRPRGDAGERLLERLFRVLGLLPPREQTVSAPTVHPCRTPRSRIDRKRSLADRLKLLYCGHDQEDVANHRLHLLSARRYAIAARHGGYKK